MATKTSAKWHSDRLGQEITLVRWGHWGVPVLVFPTAGGDAEEIERMGLVDAVGPLIVAGRVKIYSCDSIAGRALAAGWGDAAYRSALLDAFEECIVAEVLPAIRADCNNPHIEPIAAGASIGAFKAVAVTCRYPHVFRAAIGMSGTYDLERLLGFRGTERFYLASPLAFLPNLGEGSVLDTLRRRFVLLPFGGGRWENPEEAWRLADLLGSKGVPNRVDAWGPEWDHDWPTWRTMLPRYLEELVPGDA